MKEEMLKVSMTALATALLAAIGEIAAPFVILCVMMVADYCTGIIKAWRSRSVCSSVGIKGILKKLGYALGIVAALGIDYVIAGTAKITNVADKYIPVFTLALIAWLTVNECISILENLVSMGVPLPAFLMKVAKRLKQSVEASADEEDENEEI